MTLMSKSNPESKEKEMKEAIALLEKAAIAVGNVDRDEFPAHNQRAQKLIDQALAILKQPKDQPSSELTKESIELDKMCVSEIVAKYESSHNAITVLKRKFRAACESDEWMESATEFYENGGCPICFSTDESGCTKGCYLGQLQTRLDTSEAENKNLHKFIVEILGDVSVQDFDRIVKNTLNFADLEASRKELLEVITRVAGLGCLRDRDMAACKKGDMCCICQAEAAIAKAVKEQS